MKYEKSLVSVITPSYKRAHRLVDRAKELAAQTYHSIEWIVVDDGSDYTRAEIEAAQIIFPFRLISLPCNSATVSIPRNVGISHSRGEFIAPADDDVIQYSNKLEDLVNHLNSNPRINLVYGQRHSLNEKSGELRAEFSPNPWRPSLPNGWGVDNGQILYRACVYEKSSLRFCVCACDWFTARNVCRDEEVASIEEFCCAYIWHDTNKTKVARRAVARPIDYQKFFTDRFDVDWNLVDNS